MFAMEKEEKMLKNVLSVKVKGLLSKWFRLAQECMLKHKKIVKIVVEWVIFLEKEGNAKPVKEGK